MRTNQKGWFGAEMRLISVILFIVEFVRGAVLVSLLPIYGAKTLGLAPDVIGAAISAHYITDTLLKMAIGYLLDRFSTRIVVQAGLDDIPDRRLFAAIRRAAMDVYRRSGVIRHRHVTDLDRLPDEGNRTAARYPNGSALHDLDGRTRKRSDRM